jgi:8-hydroxy-5-deazaflavin:NADPH oxidoreductase
LNYKFIIEHQKCYIMKIGILGTGIVGQVLAEKFVQLNHQVMIGTRNKEKTLAKKEMDIYGRPPLSEWLNNNQKVRFGVFEETAAFGEFLVNATHGVNSIDALKLAGDKNLENKVLLDTANPLDFSKGMPPTLTISNTDSLGEQIQKAFPNTKVVKSLNTLNAYIMVNPSLLPEETNLFLSGNDADAKIKVKELFVSFGWKEQDIIDLGDISTSRGTEQLLPMWARLYALGNPMFNFKIVTGNPPVG